MNNEAVETWIADNTGEAETYAEHWNEWQPNNVCYEILDADGNPIVTVAASFESDYLCMHTFRLAPDRQLHGLLRSWCAALSQWAKDNDRSVVRVNGPVTEAMRSQLEPIGFEGSEAAGWSIDVSDADNGLVRYSQT
jgi:hypothetical protein